MDKKDFINKVKTYINFSNYIDKLEDLGISIWERNEVGDLLTEYVNSLSTMLGLKTSTKYNNVIEHFLYECDYSMETLDEDIERLYNSIPLERIYMVEEDMPSMSDFYNNLMKEKFGA